MNGFGMYPTPLQSSGEFAAFSSFLFTNNLGVSLAAFALGMTLREFLDHLGL